MKRDPRSEARGCARLVQPSPQARAAGQADQRPPAQRVERDDVLHRQLVVVTDGGDDRLVDDHLELYSSRSAPADADDRRVKLAGPDAVE
jgi:hypothetical protein